MLLINDYPAANLFYEKLFFSVEKGQICDGSGRKFPSTSTVSFSRIHDLYHTLFCLS